LIGGALYLSKRDKVEPLSPPQLGAVQKDSFQRLSPETLAQLSAIEAKEQQLNETVWAPEILAQGCSRTFDTLWDSINAATNKLDILARFQLGELLLPKWRPSKLLAHGIELTEPDGPGGALRIAALERFCRSISKQSWQLEQIEFRTTSSTPTLEKRETKPFLFFRSFS